MMTRLLFALAGAVVVPAAVFALVVVIEDPPPALFSLMLVAIGAVYGIVTHELWKPGGRK